MHFSLLQYLLLSLFFFFCLSLSHRQVRVISTLLDAIVNLCFARSPRAEGSNFRTCAIVACPGFRDSPLMRMSMNRTLPDLPFACPGRSGYEIKSRLHAIRARVAPVIKCRKLTFRSQDTSRSSNYFCTEFIVSALYSFSRMSSFAPPSKKARRSCSNGAAADSEGGFFPGYVQMKHFFRLIFFRRAGVNSVLFQGVVYV